MNHHVAVNGPGLADAEWQRLTGAANDAFAAGDRLREALLLYRAAFAEAERLFHAAEIAPSDVPAPTIFVVSCQNLAEATRRSEGDEAARAWLRRAFDRLVATAESPRMPLNLRIDCMRDLKIAFLSLAEHNRDEAAFAPEKQGLIERGRSAVLSVTQLVEHFARAGCEKAGTGFSH
ncbi:hypothetical protein [Bosea sp. 685]|uniref:hypothetical protein n=1 Tax=Bosea sp. 685 TaxID=3080057 RepID=UPI002892DE7D|nr:hypothetical protein [Bosea sp. 685]WNJ92245.1 hypothetical protein RMR04_08095 [Bosea sp. 685]